MCYNVAAVHLCEAASERQADAQARALGFRCLIAAAEHLEDARQRLWPDADA